MTRTGVSGVNSWGSCVVTVIVWDATVPSPETTPFSVSKRINPLPRSPTILFSSGFFWKLVKLFGISLPDNPPNPRLNL